MSFVVFTVRRAPRGKQSFALRGVGFVGPRWPYIRNERCNDASGIEQNLVSQRLQLLPPTCFGDIVNEIGSAKEIQ